MIVQDNCGEMITNKTVLSDSCENGVCSTSIPSSDSNCHVTVRASNVFGHSDFAVVLGEMIMMKQLIAYHSICSSTLGMVINHSYLCGFMIANIMTCT